MKPPVLLGKRRGRAGGGGPRVWNDWCSSFQQITFNLGNFTNLKELFQVDERLVTQLDYKRTLARFLDRV